MKQQASASSSPRTPKNTVQHSRMPPLNSNAGASKFRSQIPIRPGHIRLPPLGPQPRSSASALPRLSIPTTAANAPVLHTFDKAFHTYQDRMVADLKEFHVLFQNLVIQEQQEKDRWYSLCIRMMQERDLARQRVQVLECSLGGSPRSRTAKRGRDDTATSTATARIPLISQERERTASSSPSVRPTRSLRTSPIPHKSPLIPPLSPLPLSSSSPGIPPISSCAVRSSSSSSSSYSSYSPSSNRSSITSEYSIAPLKENSCVDEHEQPEHFQHALKRRKSRDGSPIGIHSTLWDYAGFSEFELSTSSQCHVPPPLPHPQVRPHLSQEMPARTPFTFVPSEFSHVDIMYVRKEDRAICRACILRAAKMSSDSSSEAGTNSDSGSIATVTEPKSFPMGATWDDLRDHVVKEHPSECADVARLHPSELFQLRKRLNLNNWVA